MNMCIIWIVALVAFVIIEAATYQFVTIWFAIGALGGIISAVLGAGTVTQICVVIGVSALSLVILRPATLRRLKKGSEKTNIDSLINAEVVITETAGSISGRGVLRGMEWAVRSADGEEIPAGETAVVKKIDGVKLVVSRKEN